MVGRSAAVLGVALWAVAGAAQAEESPVPTPPSSTSVDSSPEVMRELARLEALLPAFAAEARNARLAVGGTFIATGLVAVPVGIVAEASWHQDYGVGLWVGGALLLGAGTLSLLWESPLEALNKSFQATAATMPAAQRLTYGAEALSSVAASARTARTVSAILDFVFAGVFYGIAVGQLVSASNSTGSDRTDLQSAAASWLVVGGLFTGIATVQLLLPSSAETAYAVYASGGSPSTSGVYLSGGVAPVHGGAVVGLGGSF